MAIIAPFFFCTFVTTTISYNQISCAV